MNKRWLLGLIPAFIGFIVGSVLNLTNLSNPVVYLRADLGTLVFLTGLSISGITVLVLITIFQFRTMKEEINQQASEDRRRFLQLLDHELKNPLTAIMAGLANLSNGQKESQRKVQRLTRLVADLRKLSDLETRYLELSRVNLNTLLQEAFDAAQTHVSSPERQFNLQIPQAPWPLPEIIADEDLLFLVIHNLFDNAIKFSTTGDTIELRASENGDHVVIEIADTGPGVPEEEIGQVWTELYRGEKARGIPGSGLGLALVDAIIARHQGEVAMRSRPGQGTVVTLRLPIRGVTNP